MGFHLLNSVLRNLKFHFVKEVTPFAGVLSSSICPVAYCFVAKRKKSTKRNKLLLHSKTFSWTDVVQLIQENYLHIKHSCITQEFFSIMFDFCFSLQYFLWYLRSIFILQQATASSLYRVGAEVNTEIVINSVLFLAQTLE